mgnify:CR=1 FL=1
MDQLEQLLCLNLEGAAARRPLGLATGRTMEPLYAALVERLLGWPPGDLAALRRSWCSFNLDEYLGLPAGDPRRYSTYMSRHLGEPLQLPPETLHLPSGGAADAHGAAQAYAAELNACGGVGVQLLGLGNNKQIGQINSGVFLA